MSSLESTLKSATDQETPCALAEAFVVCENFREGFTPDLTNPLLDFSYSNSSIPPAQGQIDQKERDGRTSAEQTNDVAGAMRYIAPFVACGDLRCEVASVVRSCSAVPKTHTFVIARKQRIRFRDALPSPEQGHPGRTSPASYRTSV